MSKIFLLLSNLKLVNFLEIGKANIINTLKYKYKILINSNISYKITIIIS